MNLKQISLTGLLLGSGVLQAASDWKPSYNDKPVDDHWLKGIEGALPGKPIVSPRADRKILVFSATAGYRHGSIPVGKVALERLGESTGAFSTIISDDPANFEADVLKTFDAVVLLSPTLDFFMPSNKVSDEFEPEEWAWLKARHERLVNNLVDYVNNGGGLMGIHSATDACYGHQAYGDAIGGYFAGHPWMWNSDVTIVVEDPEHSTMKPVFGSEMDFALKEEIYKFREEPYSRDNLRVLLRLDPERSDKVDGVDMEKDYPVAWVQQVGQGRVFYTSIGHNDHIYTNPLMLNHYLAGIQFATGDLDGDTTPSNLRNK